MLFTSGLLVGFVYTAQLAALADSPAQSDHPKLWYDKPAAHWNEALPLGNGRLGAMVFGSPHKERLQLNEESLWAGRPVEAWPENFFEHLTEVQRRLLAGKNWEAHQYGLKHLTATPTSFRSYQPLGDLWLDFGTNASITGFRRELDLFDAVARVTWKQGGATLTRETFISAPDDVLVVRVTTDRPGTLGFGISLTRERNAVIRIARTNEIHLDGQIIDVEAKDGGYEDNPGGSGPGGAHMKFAARVTVRVDDGSVRPYKDRLQVTGATEALILLSAATDYNLAKLNFDRKINPGKKARNILQKANSKSWQQLVAAHLKEHRAMFGRVAVSLRPNEPAKETLPTDARIEAVRKGNDDPDLVALHFQFGRYLLMGSSRRPGCLPANLQGIWNDKLWAPWESDYHLNINLQMNYWPARAANLHETAEPLLDWFELLARRGRQTSRRLYRADGWTAFLATNPYGRASPSASTLDSQFLNSSLDPLCGAWMAAEMFDHFQFSGDREFLRRLWPILEGASEFVLDTLITAPDGTLVIAPSTSPENSYVDAATRKRLRITIGSTYHMTIVRALFDATDRAGAILGADSKTRERIAVARTKLPPIKLGEDGRILEWMLPYKEDEPGHRHMSHLLGLFPFDFITPQSPALFKGARKTIRFRIEHGGGGFGWSRAWMISFFARLQDGETAREQYLALLQRDAAPNLFNGIKVYQIDGNFGATAGLCEMLLQSHERQTGSEKKDQHFVIQLLPALPSAWSSGSAKGLSARGGFTVDMEWKEGKLTSALVHFAQGGQCAVRWKQNVVQLKTNRGEQYPITF